MMLSRAVHFGKKKHCIGLRHGTIVRTHVNHSGGVGGGGDSVHPRRPTTPSGPRVRAAALGLEAAQHTSNILRLLETATTTNTTYRVSDAMTSVWHARALSWRWNRAGDRWQAVSPFQQQPEEEEADRPESQKTPTIPRLHAIQFSDNCTALVKCTGYDGVTRYLSLLRLSSSDADVNDGWRIVRELQAPHDDDDGPAASESDSLVTLQQTLRSYLKIEHGGGKTDAIQATRLFAPQASLLTVGTMAPEDAPHHDDDDDCWSAPAGHYLEISLDTYGEGVETQTPHDDTAKTQDAVCHVDVTGVRTAAAVVRVGNGSRTLVFEDHLLLGRHSSGVWKILSKTFSPQAWP